MNKYKNDKINYDVVVCAFFNSVIKHLSEYRSRCDMSEQSVVSDTLARLTLMSKDPYKYHKENKGLYKDGELMGLSFIRNANGHHDISRAPLVKDVLVRLGAYYDIPSSKCRKDALDSALKEYFITYTDNVFRQIQYTLLRPGRMLAVLTKQKTK